MTKNKKINLTFPVEDKKDHKTILGNKMNDM